MTKFQKYLLIFLLVGLFVFAFIFIRQQELSRCKSFFAEQKDKIEGKIDFARYDSGNKGIYKWCDFVVYGISQSK